MGGGGSCIALSAFTLPAVRAAARQFLDMFRVANFRAGPLPPRPAGGLKTSIDLPQLFTDQLGSRSMPHLLKRSTPWQRQASSRAFECGNLHGGRSASNSRPSR